MSTPDAPFSVSFHTSMSDVDAAGWDALARGAPLFLRREWLRLLETSGSVGPRTGWLPLHCAVSRDGRMVGAAPLYAKSHGHAEFVYDQLWADLARRLERPYYPKLVAASPFTPAACYRFLTDPDLPSRALNRLMLRSMDQLASQNGLSGLHVLFAQDAFAGELEKLGLHAWEHQSFFWRNEGYADFEDFLRRFGANQRRNIRRERARLRDQGVRVRVLDARDCPDAWFALMYEYYADTNDKFGEWGCKFLTREFFQGLARSLRDDILFAVAFQGNERHPMAMAMLVRHNETLYGRYWGCLEEVPFLHFELCYYAPIAFAIEQGITLFDPGMGGEHKPRRGFQSATARSLHRFSDPVLDRLFVSNIRQINRLTHEHVSELNALCGLRQP